MEDKRLRLQELTEKLKRASRAYYAEDREVMSNLEYDRLYDELLALEKETGITLPGSPTRQVGYEVVEDLPKERHDHPMLSLNKTKSVEELESWLGDQAGLLSWKMDGITVVLTYEDGSLRKAVTRGNGEVGEVITPNARVFENLPLTIPYRGRLILRGEAVIRYSDFEQLQEQEPAYKNPRNLCSGSVRQLDSAVTAARHVRFYAFALVETAARGEYQAFDAQGHRTREWAFLQEQGFETVSYRLVTAATVADAVAAYAEEVRQQDVPSDGLVLLYDDIAYGEALGRTAKYPRNAIAFKWEDAQEETTLLDVEWSASRTGLINPVAVFAPVELEGTTVQRASLHNVSIVQELGLGIGDRILVYKANMIIPQVSENLTRSGTLPIPERCPVCGALTQRKKDNDSEVLFCPNPDCAAKQLKSFVLFVGRQGVGIDGLSEMTLEKLIARGFVHTPADLFRLQRYQKEIEEMEGFGEKSFANLQNAIDKAREVQAAALLAALGVPGIGAATARTIAEHFDNDLGRLREASVEELSAIDGVGPVLAENIRGYFADPKKMAMLEDLLREVRIRKEETLATTGTALAGKTFVITGAVTHFANREELSAKIRSLGGQVTGSVSSKTDYLINNDAASTSGKNKKAKELGIPVLTEDAFLEMIGEAP